MTVATIAITPLALAILWLFAVGAVVLWFERMEARHERRFTEQQRRLWREG